MAAWAAGADESSDISGMRQRGWQMTLPTEKGVALMVVAIDASCCDWGDGKMVRLLMEEKVAGCSNRGEGVSIQRWEQATIEEDVGEAIATAAGAIGSDDCGRGKKKQRRLMLLLQRLSL
ncbi:hypothetical protein BHM03_00016280 [Ensete ventricosum]|nr:hypothetical protein BHM03_00016280 [Ensete ventricosum]